MRTQTSVVRPAPRFVCTSTRSRILRCDSRHDVERTHVHIPSPGPFRLPSLSSPPTVLQRHSFLLLTVFGPTKLYLALIVRAVPLTARKFLRPVDDYLSCRVPQPPASRYIFCTVEVGSDVWDAWIKNRSSNTVMFCVGHLHAYQDVEVTEQDPPIA